MNALPTFIRSCYVCPFTTICFALSLTFSGCNGPSTPRQGGASLEDTQKIVLMEPPGIATTNSLFWALKVGQIVQTRAAGGQLKIVAQIQNRTNGNLALQIQTVFKDSHGTPNGDETNWEPVVVPAYSTYAYMVVAGATSSTDFVIRVRRLTTVGH